MVFEGAPDFISSLLGVEADILLLVGLFLIIFSLYFVGSSKLFRENNVVALIVSLVLAFITMRYMPEEAYDFLGQYIVLIFLIGLILFLWIVPEKLLDIFHIYNRVPRNIIRLIFYVILLAWVIPQLSQIEIINTAFEQEAYLFGQAVTIKGILQWAVGIAMVIALFKLFKKTREEQDVGRIKAETGKLSTEERLFRKQMEVLEEQKRLAKQETIERKNLEAERRWGGLGENVGKYLGTKYGKWKLERLKKKKAKLEEQKKRE